MVSFDLVKKPGLVWIVMEHFQYNYILSLAFNSKTFVIIDFILTLFDLAILIK